MVKYGSRDERNGMCEVIIQYLALRFPDKKFEQIRAVVARLLTLLRSERGKRIYENSKEKVK